MYLLFMAELTPDDLHKLLLEKDAFTTFAWQGRSIEEQRDFCVLLAKLPQELKELILLFAGSQDPHKEDALLVPIDAGELYIHLKEKKYVVAHSIAPCSYCLAFIHSQKSVQVIHEELSQYNDTVKNWSFGLLRGREERVFLLFE